MRPRRLTPGKRLLRVVVADSRRARVETSAKGDQHAHARRHAPLQRTGQPRCAGREDLQAHWRRVVGRRWFLKGVGLAGAGALPGSALLTGSAFASTGALTKGDAAILRFLAAAELIESDL